MFQSIPHMIFNTIAKYPDNDALRFKRDGEIHHYTYTQFGELIKKMAHGMAFAGLKKGDKIAILSNNRPEWPICDFASFVLQAVVVPIYQTLPSNQIAYILNDAEVRAIFVENLEQLGKILEIKDKIPTLEFIFTFEKTDVQSDFITLYDELLEKGESHLKDHTDFFEKNMETIEPTDICSLVYTSGTTGNPKGVMLHHHGFVLDVINAEAVFTIYPEDVFLSFLPLSHLYERLAGHWCPMYKGATVHYAQGIDTVIDDIAEARPTVMVSVPRLYEKIAMKVMDQVENSPVAKRKIFYWALNTGLKYHEKRYEGQIPPLLKMKYNLADKLAFQKIKAKLGGRFRFPISGGAPLSPDTLKFFEAMGLQIIEGYGMTETHLIITLTPTGKSRYGSCGKPINGVEVKISEEGEILVKGETLMKGYFNKPEMTQDMIDADGWLHTGDIGHLDEDDYLYITDRIKNIIVTSGGKNVASAPIENKLKTSRYIEDVCLIGNERKFISALIIPNFETLQAWLNENEIQLTDKYEIAKDERVNEMLWKEIEDLQAEFARYEKVKKFSILAEPLSIDRGELTPSLKIKRNVVEKNYKTMIDAMYEEATGGQKDIESS